MEENTAESRAKGLGLTRRVTLTTATEELNGWISAAAELDGEFEFVDADNGEHLVIKGWLAEINDVEA